MLIENLKYLSPLRFVHAALSTSRTDVFLIGSRVPPHDAGPA